MAESQPLCEIVYVSTAESLWDATTLEAILETSRKLNTKKQITGMLIYCEGGIIQVLEGPEEALRNTFTRIEADKRHKNIIPLVDRVIPTRNFENWSMGAARCTMTEVAKALGAFDIFDQNSLRKHLKNDVGGARKMLRSFAQRYQH